MIRGALLNFVGGGVNLNCKRGCGSGKEQDELAVEE